MTHGRTQVDLQTLDRVIRTAHTGRLGRIATVEDPVADPARVSMLLAWSAGEVSPDSHYSAALPMGAMEPAPPGTERLRYVVHTVSYSVASTLREIRLAHTMLELVHMDCWLGKTKGAELSGVPKDVLAFFEFRMV